MDRQQTKSIFLPNNPFLEEVDTYLKAGKKVFIRVRGTSMLPFLREGDKVLLVSPNCTPICKGSIVLAHTYYGYRLHRVIGVKAGAFVIAGDANARLTEKIVFTDIKGVVVEAYRNDFPLHINELGKRLASRVWMFIRPLRGCLLGVYLKINKI